MLTYQSIVPCNLLPCLSYPSATALSCTWKKSSQENSRFLYMQVQKCLLHQLIVEDLPIVSLVLFTSQIAVRLRVRVSTYSAIRDHSLGSPRHDD